MAESRPRLLIIGLDAAEPGLIQEWVAAGRLPALANLLRRGAWAPLRSVPNACSPAAWTTFMTGTNPGRHGIYDFTERVPGSYVHRPINGSRRDGVPFWQWLSADGFRVGVLNVPMTFPAEPVNGFLLAGMDAPDLEAPDAAYPPDLLARLTREVSAGILRLVQTGGIGFQVLRGHLDRAVEMLQARIEARSQVAEALLRLYAPDVLILAHTETDAVQHYFWKYMDRSHPDYVPEAARRYGDAIRRVYEQADVSVDRLCRAFGDAATVMILSDHGAGVEQHRTQFLRLALRELGFSRTAGGRAGRRGRQVLRRMYAGALSFSPRLLGGALRRSGRRLLSPALARWSERPLWSATRAYVASYGGICINLRGREAEGIVAPGGEYEALRQEIAEALQRCTDPATGAPIVDRVYRREDIYGGPHLDGAPDLYVELNERVGVFSAFRVGARVVPLPRPFRPISPLEIMSGGHRPEGVLILAGGRIRPGAALQHPRLADVAPTAVHALGAAVPAGLDGRVLLEAFVDSAERPVTYRQRAPGSPGAVHDFTPDEEAAVAERLRALGYL